MERLTVTIFFCRGYHARRAEATPLRTRLRGFLRLIATRRRVQFDALFSNASRVTVKHATHRFEETIGGRLYHIEVMPVAHDRWRAFIVRLPGLPTALMPFYGETPEEAAHRLCDWLACAHQRAGSLENSA